MAPPPLRHVILDLISLVWQISRVELMEIGVTLLLRVSSKVLSMHYYFSADALMNKLLIANKSAAMMTFTKQSPWTKPTHLQWNQYQITQSQQILVILQANKNKDQALNPKHNGSSNKL